MDLTREQTFVEKEATAEDIVLLIKTLWRRADDIPCSPLLRISFHNMLLLAGIGGFRPGILVNIKYNLKTGGSGSNKMIWPGRRE